VRPLRLQIEGFTCFKERQELDLSPLRLFAIIGPNGAGKSSLLDAMMLSLYGEVPRVGNRYTELISHGCPRMAVVLDFRVGERVFRVTRTRRRAGAAQAQLEELIDGDERPLADGVREVDRQIQVFLGLPYEAFTQAVVLPQGEFWKFLKSQPRERREILRELLRHQVYERMRQLAADRAGALGQAVRGLQQRLDEDYAGATPEALTDLRARAERFAVEAGAAEAERDRRRQVLQEAQAGHAKTRELHACRGEVRTLEARGPEVQKMDRRVEAARRVAPVMAVIRGAEEVEQAAEGQVRQADVSEATLARARETLAAERRHLDVAEVAAKELPALRDRIRQLDEVRGLVQAREGVRTRLVRGEEQRRAFTVDLGKAERAEGRARVSAEQIEGEVLEAVIRVRKLRYDADLDAGLEAVRDLAATLGTLRQRAVTLEATRKRAAVRGATEEAAAAKRQADAEAANDRLADAVRALEEGDRAVRDAEQKGATALLRQGLQAGEPCPVCGQAVTTLPRPVKLPQLEALRAERQRASEREQQARQAANQAAAGAAAAQATAQEARVAAEEMAQEVGVVVCEIARQEAELEVKIGTAVASEPGATLEARVQAAVQRIVGLRQRHQEALRAQQQAEKRLDAARVEIERAVHGAQVLRGRLEQVAGQIQEAEAELSRLDVDIGRVTQAPDPLAERAELAARQERLEWEVEAARRAHQASEAQLAAARARAEAERKAASEATRRARQARQQAAQAAREAGFEDEAAAEAATLPDAEVARLASEVEHYRRQFHAAARRIAGLSEELAGREVTDEELATVEAASTEQERLVVETRRELARLEAEVHNLAKRVHRAAELARELGERQRAHGVYRRLADDLRSERFQAFVLDESFRELAKGGSARLMNLSGRYTFEYHEDSFYVVDHDNAREQRSADTLSGGETFLASLALALELSEQVQAAAAAVPLDSLFIDEGFGTLDPETLETVAGAIEALPLGGRMVGIITHVAELAERLPARVMVEKRSEGSRVRVEAS
jgi:DNA repair protein SbcC/Rad50